LKEPTVTLHEYRALADMRHRIRCFLNFSEAAARAAGIEPQQHQLLLALKGLAPEQRPTVGAVADRLQIHHNSAVELARRTVANGWIERQTSPRDRREAMLRITRRGEAVLRRLSLAHRNELRVAGVELLHALEALAVGGRRAKPASPKDSNGHSGVEEARPSHAQKGSRTVDGKKRKTEHREHASRSR
jgi:DNA-binding MarR family transcriptional regulator